MQIPVAVQPDADNGYRARGGEPFGLTAHGATPDEAVQNLRALIQGQLDAGVQIVVLDLPPAQHPLAEFAGMYSADDPLVRKWKKGMAAYRRRIDKHPELP